MNQLRNCANTKDTKKTNLTSIYLEKEINRIIKIIKEQELTIQNVELSRNNLINSRGVTYTDTTRLKSYVKIKGEQREMLTKWKKSKKELAYL